MYKFIGIEFEGLEFFEICLDARNPSLMEIICFYKICYKNQNIIYVNILENILPF